MVSIWWNDLSIATKGLVVFVSTAITIFGIFTAAILKADTLMRLPDRVYANEVLLGRISNDIAEIRTMLIEMNCEDRGLNRAECLAERLIP